MLRRTWVSRGFGLLLICLIGGLLVSPMVARGQTNDLDDVVYLKDGSVIRGTIVEQVPGESVRIRTKDGNIFVYNLSDVDRMTKEPRMESESSRWGLIKGFKAGLVSPGAIWVNDEIKLESDMSYSFGAFLDYQLGPKIHGGFAVDMSNFSVESESSTMIDLSLALKAFIQGQGSNIAFRPGFALSYGILSSNDVIDSSTYFTVMGIGEILFASSSSVSWLLELAIIGSPSGGNDDFDATYGAGFRARGGIVF